MIKIKAKESWFWKDHPERGLPTNAKNQSARKKIHDKANKFSELTKENQLVFLEIKSIILEFFDSVNIYCYGSRVEGDFRQNSDYDIIVSRDKGFNELAKELLFIKFKQKNYKVDIRFIKETPKSLILIP